MSSRTGAHAADTGYEKRWWTLAVLGLRIITVFGDMSLFRNPLFADSLD